MSRDTIIFLLTQLGFVINLKMSILVPVQQIELLGLEIDSVEMKLFLSQNAMEGSLTLRDLTKLLGKLPSTIQRILPAKLQIRFLQQIQIQALRKNMTYESVINLDQQAKEDLSWWIVNMQTYNGKSLLIVPPDLTIFSDASKKGWDASCLGITTGGLWSSVEKAWHINVLELEAVRLAILSFTKFKKLKSIHLRRDNMTALSYLEEPRTNI